MSSLITGPSVWNFLSGDTTALDARITALEDKRVRTTRFAIISTTTGTITKPTASTIIENDFGGTVDAVISEVSGGKPTFEHALDSGDVIVDTTFDTSGNYALSSTPVSASYCIIYRVDQRLADFDSTATDIIGIPTVYSTSTTGTFLSKVTDDSYSNNIDSTSTGYFKVPHGTTAQGLTFTGGPGMIRYDDELKNYMVWYEESNVWQYLATEAILVSALNNYLNLDGSSLMTGEFKLSNSIAGALSTSSVNLTPIWNTSGTPTAIKLNITDTTSNPNSLLMDLQTGGTSRFKVTKGGAVTAVSFTTGNITLSSNSIIPSVNGFVLLDSTSNRTFSFANSAASVIYFKINTFASNPTSGTILNNDFSASFSPTSGTATIAFINVAPTINQTGGASGITRGIYINPTLTSAADFRALDIAAGKVVLSATNTATGTTGNQTINKISGTVNFAAAATALTVTNNLVTTSSIVHAVVRTNDATATIKNVVPAAGSFTINLGAAATAETSVGFTVFN